MIHSKDPVVISIKDILNIDGPVHVYEVQQNEVYLTVINKPPYANKKNAGTTLFQFEQEIPEDYTFIITYKQLEPHEHICCIDIKNNTKNTHLTTEERNHILTYFTKNVTTYPLIFSGTLTIKYLEREIIGTISQINHMALKEALLIHEPEKDKWYFLSIKELVGTVPSLEKDLPSKNIHPAKVEQEKSIKEKYKKQPRIKRKATE